MTVEVFTVSPFQSNCYICHANGEGVLIDPGCSNTTERRVVLDYISENGISIDHLLLTHGHLDHVLDCAFFADHFEKRFQMHAADVPLIERAAEQGMMFGVQIDPPPPPGRLLDEGDVIEFGGARWEILHCPGHSPGSICFVDRGHSLVIAGDVIFRGSIGRTDLWGGSMDELVSSIRSKLFVLPDDCVLYTGHGEPTTVGEEKRSNPFLQ